jgi:predicted peroxiredoxin
VVASQPVLVVVSEDPRASHRANEAIRIALGVAAGENDVTIVLTGPAVHLLDADTDELVDGDDIAKVRGSLKKLGVPFHVEADAIPADPDWNEEGHPIVRIGPGDVARLAAATTRSIVF